LQGFATWLIIKMYLDRQAPARTARKTPLPVSTDHKRSIA